MGDGTEKNPYTREDVLRLIKENGDTAEGLDLSEKWFEDGIDLSKLNLTGIILNNAILRNAHLEGTYLWYAHFKKADLGGACLKGANLWGAHLEEAYLGDNAHLERANLSRAYLGQAYLVDAYLYGAFLWGAHLERADLGGAHLEGAILAYTEFTRDTKLEEVDWGNYTLGEEKNGNFYSATATYRRLKIWYTEHGLYDIAGKFFYREMEARRKAQSWKQPHLKLWYWVMRMLCGYGEKPERVIISAAAVVFGLALIYFGIGTLTPATFLNSLYYSAVSFIALGYGSWVKEVTGWVKGLGVFEAFVGFIMMTLFLVTFVRKWTR